MGVEVAQASVLLKNVYVAFNVAGAVILGFAGFKGKWIARLMSS